MVSGIESVIEETGGTPAYVCGRCGKSLDDPQQLRIHEDDHVAEGDEEVEEEWEHTPGEPTGEIEGLGGDTGMS